MVLETGLHPGALKDMVASPGGTTIEGLCELEKGGLRGTLINAVRAAAESGAVHPRRYESYRRLRRLYDSLRKARGPKRRS